LPPQSETEVEKPKITAPSGSLATRRALREKKYVALFTTLSHSGRWKKLMPAIASIEDLRNAQKELLEARDIEELKRVFKKWRRIGWKNICKLWLEERTPEQLKGEGE
jgi:hypothetical protein